jgi:hypothetical protein
LKRALSGWLILTLLGCSRHEPSPAPSVESSAGAALPSSTQTANPSQAPSSLPAREDANDADAAQRINEQNLESELDRLEREIQAE